MTFQRTFVIFGFSYIKAIFIIIQKWNTIGQFSFFPQLCRLIVERHFQANAHTHTNKLCEKFVSFKVGKKWHFLMFGIMTTQEFQMHTTIWHKFWKFYIWTLLFCLHWAWCHQKKEKHQCVYQAYISVRVYVYTFFATRFLVFLLAIDNRKNYTDHSRPLSSSHHLHFFRVIDAWAERARWCSSSYVSLLLYNFPLKIDTIIAIFTRTRCLCVRVMSAAVYFLHLNLFESQSCYHFVFLFFSHTAFWFSEGRIRIHYIWDTRLVNRSVVFRLPERMFMFIVCTALVIL